MPTKGAQAPQVKVTTPTMPLEGGTQGIGAMHTDSLLESQSLPMMAWVRNVAKVRINGESCMALLDNGAQINYHHA